VIAGTGDSGAGERARALVYSPRAKKALSKLPADVQQQITAALGRFAATGYGDVRKMTDKRPPEYRLRVGDWRARLTLTAAAVEVERVANRREAY
jgi:mRNA interferase RelE/StbE